ncbi:MAG: neutral/alkaline non-lysosomal ceramidase N-terminal domain-containing protein [Verrucomicrobiota bacterium]
MQITGSTLASAPRDQPFQAGWAKVAFDIPIGTPLAGYAYREGAPSEGFRQSLYARSFVLRTAQTQVAIICTDLLIVPPEVAEIVRDILRPLDITPLFTASHTHGGPGAWDDSFVGELMAGEYDKTIVNRLAQACIASTKLAIDDLAPAEFSWIELAEPDWLYNRTVEGGTTDPALEALLLRRRDEIGIISMYGAHPTCYSHQTMHFHGDYPGVIIDELEHAAPISLAAFAAGAVGSQNVKEDGKTGQLQAESIGMYLGRKLLLQMDTLDWKSDITLAAENAPFHVTGMQLRVSNRLRTSPTVLRSIHPGRSSLTALRIDDHLWLGVPFELSSMLSQPLRKATADSGWRLHITCFSGDYLGYVIPDHLYPDHNIYEAQMNFMGPHGGSYSSALMQAVIQSASSNF